MATTAERASQVKCGREGEALEAVEDRLEALARDGARQMLCQALSEEIDAYLGRGRYERIAEHRGYRNGSTFAEADAGGGSFDLAVPRVRDVPAGQEPSRQRSSASTSAERHDR